MHILVETIKLVHCTLFGLSNTSSQFDRNISPFVSFSETMKIQLCFFSLMPHTHIHLKVVDYTIIMGEKFSVLAALCLLTSHL